MSVPGPLGATESGSLEIRTRALRTRAASLSDRAGAIALAGLLLTTLLVVLGAAHTNVLLPESVRPLPGFLSGPFGNTGLSLGWGGVIVVLIAMFGAYAVA